MRDPAYAAFSALDPFFDIVRQGLAGLVDGDHYFDTIAPNAVFEFRYRFPGWPTKLVGREALMALYAGYGEGMALHGADALVVNISQTSGVVILEYEVQGNAVGSRNFYENRFISVVTIEDRKIVGWRDYMGRWRRCPHLPSVLSLTVDSQGGAVVRVCGDEQDRSDHDQCGGGECTTSIGNMTAEGIGSSSPSLSQCGPIASSVLGQPTPTFRRP